MLNKMEFISHGDFGFPLNFSSFLKESVFLLKDSGVLNLEGIFRLFSKIPILVIFAISNNLVASYFYLVFVFALGFFSEVVFLKRVMHLEDKWTIILVSLFFSINPVFLGNISKTGLILSVNLLPLVLTSLYEYFQNIEKWQYLVGSMVLLGISFVHPFTFLVNVFLFGIFFVVLLVKNKGGKIWIISKTLLALVLTGLIFSFAILSFAGTGFETNKSAIMNLEDENPAFVELIEISNTKTFYNSLILYKPAFLDYKYFDEKYYPIYLISNIGLLFIAGASLFFKKKRIISSIFVLGFVILGLLSSAKLELAQRVLYCLNSISSVGWAFRSPLKWQLYLPFVYSGLISITLSQFKKLNLKKILCILTALLVIFANLFLILEINSKLLHPKEFEFFSESEIELLDYRSLLVIRNLPYSAITPELSKMLLEISILEKSRPIKISYSLELNINENYDYLLYLNDEGGNQSDQLIWAKEGAALYLKNISTRINLGKGEFQKLNPTKYNFYLSDISYERNLSFLESYHNDWKLYLKKNPSNDWCEPFEFFEETGTTECKHEMKFFEGEEFSYLWEEPIFDETHTMIYDYANSWEIDPHYIKDNFSEEYYTENPDGSIDIELVMYFKPQSYFYLGLLISSLTFIGCVGYLIYDWKKLKTKQMRQIHEE